MQDQAHSHQSSNYIKYSDDSCHTDSVICEEISRRINVKIKCNFMLKVTKLPRAQTISLPLPRELSKSNERETSFV